MDRMKQYFVFLVGLFINSLGVSIITKANLGTSPISSIPYVLSLNFPLTLGTFTVLFSLILIAIQLLILRKDFRLEHWLQIPISVAFGYFIDLTTAMMENIHLTTYPAQMGFLLLGCVVLGLGVYIVVLPNVAMLPGESFVRAVCITWKKEFGSTKIVFDVSMTLMAAALSFFFVQELEGVREGSIIAALLVVFIARQLNHRLQDLPKRFLHLAPTEK